MTGVSFRLPGVIIFTLLLVPAIAQKKGKEDRATMDLLKKHVQILADDRMQGRRAGTVGADIARDYIKERFQEYGLSPGLGDTQWIQPFTIYEGKQAESSTFLNIDGEYMKLGEDFFPLSWSKNGTIQAVASPALFESFSPWLIDLQKLMEENEKNPHFDLMKAIRQKEKQAVSKSASALIFYNNHLLSSPIVFNKTDTSGLSSVPILILNRKSSEIFTSDKDNYRDIHLKVEVVDKLRYASNVAGYLDNKAQSTIIIGAHYDHLGFGEDNNSRYTGESLMIHNGADDNASGTAAMIELARLLKKNGSKSFNYLFVAFSAEELGLFGSKYFTENMSVNASNINYMINLDMIGRLNDTSRSLTIGGVGTSPSWGKLIFSEKKLPFKIKVDSSGTGPSDHTSFYRKGIPVLFFFTGIHNDYHHPYDDAEKINYKGQLDIIQYICRIIQRSTKEGQLAFTKTREQSTTTGARFNVSLGIMPDYAYLGPGVKADGISADKPAEKVGILAGDIIISLDQDEIADLESYMQILSKYKKGDPAQVKVKRGENVLTFSIVF